MTTKIDITNIDKPLLRSALFNALIFRGDKSHGITPTEPISLGRTNAVYQDGLDLDDVFERHLGIVIEEDTLTLQDEGMDVNDVKRIINRTKEGLSYYDAVRITLSGEGLTNRVQETREAINNETASQFMTGDVRNNQVFLDVLTPTDKAHVSTLLKAAFDNIDINYVLEHTDEKENCYSQNDRNVYTITVSEMTPT